MAEAQGETSNATALSPLYASIDPDRDRCGMPGVERSGSTIKMAEEVGVEPKGAIPPPLRF